MTPTREEIVSAFNRLEQAAGGYAQSDAKEVLRAVAAKLDLPYERVRSVMIDVWIGRGGG